jgi:adenylate cyclase
LTEQALDLARQAKDPLQVAIARWILGTCQVNSGELESAREHLEHVIAFYDPEQHAPLVTTLAQDLGVSVMSWASWVLWFLGYPDQAREQSQEALALARELGHPYTLAFALFIAAFFHQLRRENEAAGKRSEELLQLSTAEEFPLFVVGGNILQGWTLTMSGQAQAGITQIRQGLKSLQAMGTEVNRSYWLALLAVAQGSAGPAEEGLSCLSEALAFVEHSGERYYEAELHRLKGELLLQQGDQAEAEASFHQAIEVAREQSAKSWEMRATVSLCRLWQQQGKMEEARQRLAEIYDWFTESCDTPDLQEARALLNELSSES